MATTRPLPAGRVGGARVEGRRPRVARATVGRESCLLGRLRVALESRPTEGSRTGTGGISATDRTGCVARRPRRLERATAGLADLGSVAPPASRHVRDLAHHTSAPIGAVLEVVYDPPALAESVIATMRALSGDDAAESIAPDRIYTRRAASYVGHH
jgi:hypothetical protein